MVYVLNTKKWGLYRLKILELYLLSLMKNTFEDRALSVALNMIEKYESGQHFGGTENSIQ